MTFSGDNLSILFLALEYWQYDIPNTAVYIVSFWYWMSRGLVFSTFVSAKGLKLVEIGWQIKSRIFFLRIRTSIVRKLQNMLSLLIYLGIQSHYCPQLQTSFLPPRSQSKSFGFWGKLVVITILSLPFDLLPIIRQLFYNEESSRFSNPGFPITTDFPHSETQFNVSYLN